MRIYKNKESLLKAIEKKEVALKKAQDESTRKFANIGWGHSMRCTKINISYSREDKLTEDLRELNLQLRNFQKVA